jgi:hypothetical protein
MTTALWLLALLGLIGAFDTLYSHEWRGRLVARREMRPELRLHVARDAIYVVVFGTLPILAWQGWVAGVLVLALLAEIVITMADFVTEDKVRTRLGGVFPGERVTHAVMGIVYGAMLAFLVPTLIGWASSPAGFVPVQHDVPATLRWGLITGAAGIAVHGLRDLAAVLQLPGSDWPWAAASYGPRTAEQVPQGLGAAAPRRWTDKP